LPRSIGLVTSPAGAALRDILNILRRRHHSANILIYPAQVQGDTAALEVSAGVKYFNRAKSVNVVIIARGGGSAEDLAAFNHEGLARSVATSEIPVISAVGHETDFTIVDFVADLRAPTPSAAAELVIRSRQDIEEQAQALRRRLARAIHYRLLMARQVLTESAQHGAFARMMDGINRRQQRLDELRFALEKAQRTVLVEHRRRWERASASVRHYDARRRLAGVRRELGAVTSAMTAAVGKTLLRQSSRIERFEHQLKALSPLAILERGYALVFDASGRLIKTSAQVGEGEQISARLAEGRLHARIESKD
ncbi:MAG: exodeoxyribonuclease VII large subunit, partial [Deltaproteobacteria bacterium]|nr:exodeoxyribonuclease VII large subunit [Deltaproteobacteria bacterium]